MTPTMKVFAGSMLVDSKQHRAIIAATTRAEASRVTGIPKSRIKHYWTITSNEAEVELAKSKPGTIFIHEMNYSNAAWAELATPTENDHREQGF